MSTLKSALSETWRGLIARRLWPLALLLVVAMAALPLFLLSSPEPPVPRQADAARDSAELATQPLVQVASPAERERLRRVLGARRDPFKPTNQPKRRAASKGDATSTRTAADEPAAATPGSDGGGAPPSTAPAKTPPSTGSGGSAGTTPTPTPTPTPGRADPAPREPALTASSITVQWGASNDERLERIRLERLDALPSLGAPALVYCGATKDGEFAVFLLDAGLAVDGDARCGPSTAERQTIKLREGGTAFLEVVETEGGATVRYRLHLVRIHGRVGERTTASRRDEDSDARAIRRALRALGQDEPVYRYDASTGTLKLAPEQP